MRKEARKINKKPIMPMDGKNLKTRIENNMPKKMCSFGYMAMQGKGYF